MEGCCGLKCCTSVLGSQNEGLIGGICGQPDVGSNGPLIEPEGLFLHVHMYATSGDEAVKVEHNMGRGFKWTPQGNCSSFHSL